MLLGAIMVKNESSRIEKTINSVLGILDGLVVLDTGCTDDTIEKIRRIYPKAEIFEGEFIDYSTTRNELLDNCLGKSEFIMMLDANDEVKNGEILKNYLKYADADLVYNRFELRSENGQYFTYTRACVFKNKKELRYEYPVHEVIKSNKEDFALIDSTYYFFQDRKDDDSTERYKKDAEILERYISQHDDIRMEYYLCQTYSNLREYEKLFESSKKLVQRKGKGYHEFIFYGFIFLGLSSHHTNREFEKHFLNAFQYSTRYFPRCEPLVLLSFCWGKRGDEQRKRLYMEEARKQPDIPKTLKNVIPMVHLYKKRWD